MARTTARTTVGRAVAALLSAAALAVLAGCSSSPAGGSGAGGPDAADPSGSVSAAPPGKYQSLPEPCGSVNRAALTAVLPTSDYRGTPALTYDNDRRVGCKWTGTADGVSRTLTIDVERVVSYDPAVSDDDKAHQDFDTLAGTARVPEGDAVPETALASPEPGATDAPVTTGSGDGHAVRAVSGIGDEAYLADTEKSKPAAGRDVTFVFRAANVVVTVEVSQLASTDSDADLQLGANQVAQELAKAITE